VKKGTIGISYLILSKGKDLRVVTLVNFIAFFEVKQC
jgi:hypothetical protein